MKTAYIFYSAQQPDHKAILDVIAYFCREHDITYGVVPNSDCNTVTIDGNDYDIKVMEQHEENDPTYWMIYCALKNYVYHLENAKGA